MGKKTNLFWCYLPIKPQQLLALEKEFIKIFFQNSEEKINAFIYWMICFSLEILFSMKVIEKGKLSDGQTTDEMERRNNKVCWGTWTKAAKGRTIWRDLNIEGYTMQWMDHSSLLQVKLTPWVRLTAIAAAWQMPLGRLTCIAAYQQVRKWRV